MIHSGFPDKYSDPKNIIEASKYNQNVRFCIAHLAWLDEESITKVKNSKNVFLDCSPFIQICNKVRNGSSSVRKPNLIDPSQPVASLLRYQSLLRDSLVWGSDEPWTKCNLVVLADIF